MTNLIVERSIKILTALFFLFIMLLFTSHLTFANVQSDIRVGFSIYNPPTLLEEDDLIIKGICVDISKIIADFMGSSVHFFIIDDFGESDVLEKGTVDFVIGIKDDFKDIDSLNTIDTDFQVNRRFFVNTNCDTFFSLEDLPGHTVILKGRNFVSRLLSSRNDIRFIEQASEEKALSILDAGEADVYICYSSLIDMSTIKKRGFYNIKEVGRPIISAPLIIATNKNNIELYNSIMKAYNKATGTIRYKRMMNLWMNKDIYSVGAEKISFEVFFSFYSKYFLAGIVCIVSFFCGIIIWNKMLKSKVRKITKDLSVSEQKYRDLIESSPDMIQLIDQNGFIKLSNKIFSDCLGYSSERISCRRLHDFVLTEETKKVDGFLDELFKKKYSKDEFVFLSKSGASIHVEMAATVVTWKIGNECLACCFSRNLMERKQLEENLIHSDRLAIIGRMAAGIAHEINNPLGIILTNTEEALNHDLNHEDLLENLRSVERNALRAGKIIEDLLTFTRPSPLNKEQFDLIQLIDESLFFLKHKIKNKNIKIEKKYSFESIMISADERQIQQLLINLILNAIQAVDNSGVISITAKTDDTDNGKKSIIEITDNGVGIHESDLPHIFNPFFSKRKKSGFGLGLFMSQIITKRHNGIISINSLIDRGTTASLKLPL